jgi:hypothetical protein
MMMMMEEGRAVLTVRFFFFFLSFFLSLRRSFCEGLGYTIALFFFLGILMGAMMVLLSILLLSASEFATDWWSEGHLEASYWAMMNEIERKSMDGWMVAYVRVCMAFFPLWMGMADWGGRLDNYLTISRWSY